MDGRGGAGIRYIDGDSPSRISESGTRNGFRFITFFTNAGF